MINMDKKNLLEIIWCMRKYILRWCVNLSEPTCEWIDYPLKVTFEKFNTVLKPERKRYQGEKNWLSPKDTFFSVKRFFFQMRIYINSKNALGILNNLYSFLCTLRMVVFYLFPSLSLWLDTLDMDKILLFSFMC